MTAGELRALLDGVDADTDVRIEVQLPLPFVEQRSVTLIAVPYHATDWSKVTAVAGFTINARTVR